MTRDGFTILAMGYTGKKAMQFKEKYIAAFNAMEQHLRQGVTQRIENLTRKQILQMALEAEEEKERLAARLAMSESRNAEIQASVESILPRIERLEKRMNEPDTVSFVQQEPVSMDVSAPFLMEEEGLTNLQRANLYDKKRLCAIHPQYMTTAKAIEKLRKRGLYVRKNDLFQYLRSNGYLSSHPEKYNCPEEHCIKNGWMLIAYAGSHHDRPKSKRPFTPYLSPKFVNLLEDILKEQLKKSGTQQLPFLAGKEVKS